MWLFDRWMFIALTLFWSIKFIGFQDFAHVLKGRRRQAPVASDAREERAAKASSLVGGPARP